MERMTAQEEKTMNYIWALSQCTVKEILAKYPKPVPPYTTVASIVKNLERKHYVKAHRIGNTYLYEPAIEESDYKSGFLGGIVKEYFQNSYKEMVSFFARESKISAKDLKEIIDLIEKNEDK